MDRFLKSTKDMKYMNENHRGNSERLSAIEMAAINKSAKKNIVAILDHLVPGESIRGHEYVARNPRRRDRRPGSFKICISGPKIGVWCDFATGDKGGDVISLVAYIKGCSREKAALILRKALRKALCSLDNSQGDGNSSSTREDTRVRIKIRISDEKDPGRFARRKRNRMLASADGRRSALLRTAADALAPSRP